METLEVLAKAFKAGDYSAFEPLIDCLLEHGFTYLAMWIWEKHQNGIRSGFCDWAFRDEYTATTVNKTFNTSMYKKKTLERFKGA